MAKSTSGKDLDVSIVDSLVSETANLQSPSKSIKLKANDKAVSIMYNLGLVGKILADKVINKNAVKAILLKAWSTAKGVQIVDLSDNIYLFKFAAEGDRKRVIELGPWNIEGFPLILKPWDQKLQVRDIDFSFIQLWVQVHNLPIEYMSKENAENIGALLGKVLEVDFTSDGLVCLSRFLRVKVEFEVSKSLKSGFFLDRDPLPDIWI
nr:hypothetical protein CFP56_48269 [Quercus suber]